MDLRTMTWKAELFRRTEKVGAKDCRIPRTREIGEDWGEGVLALAWKAAGMLGDPPQSVRSSCGTAGCVMHLAIGDADERDEQIVLQSWKPAKSLAQMFRDGRSRGLFKGISTYAD